MTPYNLENKVAVITGGAQGIGHAIAEHFLKKGAKTAVLLDIKEDGAKTADELNTRYGPNKAVYIKCDVTKDLDTVSRHIFQMVKAVDILVNNAGIGGYHARKVMETNLTAPMEWSIKFLEHMQGKNNGGTIINISSACMFSHDKFSYIYKPSKYGVYAFSKTLGHLINYNQHGVRVIVICPAFTESEINLKIDLLSSKNKQMREEYMEFISHHNLQKPERVGQAITEVYEKADSGTAWLIMKNRAIGQISI